MVSSETVFTLQHVKETIPDVYASPSSSEENIFSQFRDIKHKNEPLKYATYSQFWKKTYTT